MNKFILSKSTILQNQFLIIGDYQVISKPSNIKKISLGEKNLINLRDIKNTKLASVYSTHDADFGTVLCGVYLDDKEKKKPKNFYYVPLNSLKHIKINDLIKKIDNESSKTGDVKITTGEISFNALLDPGYKHHLLKNQKTQKNEWNNSFTYKVDNGIYDVYSYDFEYEGPEVENFDTMFSVKKRI